MKQLCQFNAILRVQLDSFVEEKLGKGKGHFFLRIHDATANDIDTISLDSLYTKNIITVRIIRRGQYAGNQTTGRKRIIFYMDN